MVINGKGMRRQTTAGRRGVLPTSVFAGQVEADFIAVIPDSFRRFSRNDSLSVIRFHVTRLSAVGGSASGHSL